MGSKSETILHKNKCERTCQDQRKHYVVFQEWNQGKCIRVEQDIDLVLKNMKLKILGQRLDEMLMMTDS